MFDDSFVAPVPLSLFYSPFEDWASEDVPTPMSLMDIRKSSPSPPNHNTNSASNIYNIDNKQDVESKTTTSVDKGPFFGEFTSILKQVRDFDEESDEDAPRRKQQHRDGPCMYMFYIKHPAHFPVSQTIPHCSRILPLPSVWKAPQRA
jgi:hypothetical protein